MSCIFGENRDIFFPKLSAELNLITFSDIAVRYLKEKGLEPYLCETEDEARNYFNNSSFLVSSSVLSTNNKQQTTNNKYPCLFTKSNTTGEKDFEEFFTDKETLDMERFENLGIIKNDLSFDKNKIELFETTITKLKANKQWNKKQIVDLFFEMIPDFEHKEVGKYLDSKM
jgi:hypothetical protein